MPGGFWKFHELREGLRIAEHGVDGGAVAPQFVSKAARSAKRSFDFALRRGVRREFASGQDSLRGREHIVVANPCRD